MSRSERFVIEEVSSPTPSRKLVSVESRPGPTPVSGALQQASAALPWIELVLLAPSKLLSAVGWLAIPLFIFAVVPVVLLGTLLLAQAPVFFLLWKLFGPASTDCSLADENSQS